MKGLYNMKLMQTVALLGVVSLQAAIAETIEPYDKYHIAEKTLWNAPPLPLPDKSKDIMSFGSCPIWFMGTDCNDHGHDNSQPFKENCPAWQKETNNALQMIDEVKRLFPDTQFVVAGVFVPPLQFPDFLKKVYAKGAFFQSQKAPVLDADALSKAGPHPIGDKGQELHTENWVMMTTPKYQDFFKKKLQNTAKLGVNNFKQVDFVWPWNQRYGYDDLTVSLFRDYLNGKDEGLNILQADGSSKKVKFWDYFEYYRGLRFNPKDLNLNNWGEFFPVKEEAIYSKESSLYERRNLIVFFLLYHYAHLNQYQQMGTWAKEVGAVHEASVNPESLYNACDNIFITRLKDFGTVYYEYFGSPLNAEAAYLFMNSYLLDAQKVGKKLGLIKELGQGGHGRPHNTPVIEYVHNFDLSSNGFSYYHNEWEEGTFQQMLDPNEKYYNNRWRVWLAGAYGYKQARDLETFRPKAKAVQLANRSGGFYTESWVWDANIRNTFGSDLLAAYVDVESLAPTQMEELLKYDTLFYTPIYTPKNQIKNLNNYLAKGKKRVITHSFIPYSLDRGVNYFHWEELPHQIAHHALDNLQNSQEWILSPIFKDLKFATGEVKGNVKFGNENLGETTIPEYWSWSPKNGKVIATIGDKPLITVAKDRFDNEFVYLHARLSRIDAKLRRKLVALMSEKLDFGSIAKANGENPLIMHKYELKNVAGDAIAIYDRDVLEKTGSVLGYRPQEDWKKTMYQYKSDGTKSAADYKVKSAGEYLVYYPLSNRLEKVKVGEDKLVKLSLNGTFAEIVFVGQATPEWEKFIAEQQVKHKEIFANINFSNNYPMLPTNHLFDNQTPTGYKYQD